MKERVKMKIKGAIAEEYTAYINSGNPAYFCIGNEVLYKMCETYPHHDDIDIIASKVLLIGRSYAATVERGRTNNSIINNDDYYYEHIAPAFMGSEVLDQKLEELKLEKGDYIDNIDRVLYLHNEIVSICKKLKGLEELTKRSFASKYLHFHCPDKVLIYDSRAAAAIRKVVQRPNINEEWKTEYDSEYVDFCTRVIEMSKCIEERTGSRPCPRQVDNFLLYYIEKL